MMCRGTKPRILTRDAGGLVDLSSDKVTMYLRQWPRLARVNVKTIGGRSSRYWCCRSPDCETKLAPGLSDIRQWSAPYIERNRPPADVAPAVFAAGVGFQLCPNSPAAVLRPDSACAQPKCAP